MGEENNDALFTDLCFVLGAWIQNVFCFTAPIVGAIMKGQKGFIVGTALSLSLFFGVGIILEGLIPVVESKDVGEDQ